MQNKYKFTMSAILVMALFAGVMLGGCGAKDAGKAQESKNATANNQAVETTEITVENTWVDNNNEVGFRPATKGITFVLYANGEKVASEDENFGKTFVEDGYTYTFTNLPVKENGKPIVYTVGLEDIDNYYSPAMVQPQEVEIVDGKNMVAITTTIRQKEIDMKVVLVWENEPDNKAEATVQLMQDGDLLQEVQTVNQEIAFDKLPMYDVNGDGHKYSYKIREINVPGYTVKCTQSKDESGMPVITISNTASNNAEGTEEATAEME